MISSDIAKRIKTSSKYKDVYLPTIERVVMEAWRRDSKHSEELARRKLHQIWGAYWRGRGALNKLEKSLDSMLLEEKHDWITQALGLHSSSWERINSTLDIERSVGLGGKRMQPDFYTRIWHHLGHIPESVVDYGCGMAPLSYELMGLLPESSYCGIDIDEKEINFLKRVIEKFGWKQAQARVGDILCGDLVESEVALCLKLFPVLEQQQKGITKELLQNISADFIVASFPIASLGGRKRGMGEFYGEWFEGILHELGLKGKRIAIDTEEVWLVDKFDACCVVK